MLDGSDEVTGDSPLRIDAPRRLPRDGSRPGLGDITDLAAGGTDCGEGFRDLCLRCLRPAAVCYCAHLAPIASATRVVFLQHPREGRVAIGTCRMAHLALAGSELHRGLCFEDHPRVRALAADTSGDVAVLYPGDDAREPEALTLGPPRTLIVLDGTWHQARTMWRHNPALHRLPRIGFMPSAPGNYRIRREPAPHCLATIEAVVEVLGRLEGDPERFRPMLRAFEQMVETQIHYRTVAHRPWRRTKRQRQPRKSLARSTLRTRRHDIVLVYAEANAHPAGSLDWGVPEIVQLVAYRPSTDARFAAIITPRRPLAPSAPHHLEIDADRLLDGEPIADAMARWRAFVAPNDLLCSWGHYAFDLLAREGDPPRPTFDLRHAVNDELGRRAGGIEQALAIVGGDGADLAPWTDGRAGRRIAALAELVRRLTDDPLPRLLPAAS